MRNLKNILLLLLILVIFVGGFWVSRYLTDAIGPQKIESSDMIMERVRQVNKLITIEGYFSEIYDYKDYKGFDVSFLRKKALIRVKAKVSVGFDLTKMQYKFDEEKKIMTIEKIPLPEILSIDHDIDYYDITEGTFNSFTPEDYNTLNRNAKEFIKSKVEASELMKMANNQTLKLIETLNLVIGNAGWKVEIPEVKK